MMGGVKMIVFYCVLGCVIGISFITGLILTIFELYQNKNKTVTGNSVSVCPLYPVCPSDKLVDDDSSDKQLEIL